jgi:predicted TIM-barrel fold metal-dependent hydrolase
MAHSGGPFHTSAFGWRPIPIHLEVSGLPAQNLLSYFPRLEELADKVVYGSDWPGQPDLRRNIDSILRLPLRDDTKVKILGGNAARLLDLDEQAESVHASSGERVNR